MTTSSVQSSSKPLPVQFKDVLPTGKKAYTIFDMEDGVVAKVESRLRPGAYSEAGFISKTDSLREICIHDLRTLQRLGVSCDQISDALKAVVQKAQDISKQQQVSSFSAKSAGVLLGNEVIIPGYLKMKLISSMGYQECPFHKREELCHKGSFEYTIQNLKTEESIKVSQLVIDLIGSHAFFEGNTSYRVNPEKLCRVLEINSRKYAMQILTWAPKKQ